MTRILSIELSDAHALGDALAQAARSGSSGDVRLRVSLLPPLAQVRRIELPRMTAGDARRAVARAAGRWFPDAREPLAVAVQAAGSAWIVAVAPAALVDAIYAAARERGWDVDCITPAHALWAAKARDGLVQVSTSAETTVVAAERGAIVAVRRIPVGKALPAELAHARPLPGVASKASVIPSAMRDLQLVRSLDLVPDAERARRDAVARRATWSLVGAAAAMLVLAAGLTLWGEHRELAALRAERMQLRARVDGALASRDTLVGTSERVTAVASLEQSSQRWSGVIARIAEALPADASLTAFRAEADSVSLEGQARDAAGVFAAMRSAPGFVAVRASSPVRQEGGGTTGQPIVERFSMAARVGRGENP